MSRSSAPPVQGRYVGVIGPGDDATQNHQALAREVGRLLGERGHIVVTGGLGGVMAAACEGAQAVGGITLGLLPSTDRREGNPHLTVSVPTGIGELRNGLLVRCADAIVAVGGSWGTLSEIALAIRTGVPVISLHGWQLPEDGIVHAEAPLDAVEKAVHAAG